MSDIRYSENAFIGEQDAIINDRGSHKETEAPDGARDFATDRFVGCCRVRKDETGAVKKVKGGRNCSLANDKFEGGRDITLIENNARKEVDGGGGHGTEVASLVVDGSEVTMVSRDCQTIVRSEGGENSITAGVIVKGNGQAKMDEKNKCTLVSKR